MYRPTQTTHRGRLQPLLNALVWLPGTVKQARRPMAEEQKVEGAEPPVSRPAPWGDPPDGFHFEVAVQDDWVIPAVGAGRCRFVTGAAGRRACGKPAEATYFRGYGGYTKPWDYCAEHLYGRWIEHGQVVGWRLVEDALDTADCPQSAPQSSPGDCDG